MTSSQAPSWCEEMHWVPNLAMELAAGSKARGSQWPAVSGGGSSPRLLDGQVRCNACHHLSQSI